MIVILVSYTGAHLYSVLQLLHRFQQFYSLLWTAYHYYLAAVVCFCALSVHFGASIHIELCGMWLWYNTSQKNMLCSAFATVNALSSLLGALI